MPSIHQDVTDFFINLARDTFKYRDENNVTRKDFMQLLLQVRNNGKVGLDGDWKAGSTTSESEKTLSIDECAAEVYLFYLAGYDTSSSAITYSLYELARNQPLLRRLQAEIDECLARHNQQITYESIQEMKLLESCILGRSPRI